MTKLRDQQLQNLVYAVDLVRDVVAGGRPHYVDYRKSIPERPDQQCLRRQMQARPSFQASRCGESGLEFAG